MSDHADLLAESIVEIMLRAEKIGKSFYDNLFEIAPEIKPFFASTEMEKQWRMFIEMLDHGLATLKGTGVLSRKMTDLAQRHDGYGAQQEHYDKFREALLMTLEQELPDFDDELRQAWSQAFDKLWKSMQRS